MSKTTLALFIGIIAGVAGALVAGSFSGPEVGSEDPAVSRLQADNDDLAGRLEQIRDDLADAETRRDALKAENEQLKGVLEERERAFAELTAKTEVPPVPEPEPAGAVTDEELKGAIEKFAVSLQAIIVGEGEDAVKALREVLDRAGPEGIEKLIDRLKNDSDLGGKIILAHALAQSGDAAALKALMELATDPDQDMIMRRFTSHGLAFADDESVRPALWEIAKNDEDIGARANAAFGIARTGDVEGMNLYAGITDQAFEKKDPAALQYLGGFLLLGEKGLPYVRERLETYEESQARLLLLEAVKANKDVESIPVLRRIIADPETDKTVRDRAETVLEEIETK